MKSGVAILFLFFLISTGYSQTPGLIVKPATGVGASVLDPNGDGYASETSQGYIVNDYDWNEIEIDFTDLVRPDPIGDPLAGPNGLYNEIVGTNDDGEHAIFTYTDGTNYIIRFRLDGYATNSKAYSLLLDTDGKFGFTGADADPNAVPGNPGFEIEIALFTNFNVVVSDVDGNADGEGNIVSGDGTNGITRSYDEYCQKSIAKSYNSNDPDYFYTFFVPFSDLLLADPTLTTSTPMRFAAVTSMNPHSSIGNNAVSDISGDNSGGGGIDNIFEDLVESQTPTVPGEEVLERSACPSINSPISSGATSVSGSSSEASGTTIKVFADDVQIGTTTTSGTSWTLSGIGPLTGGQVVYATATASGKGESNYSCNTTFVGSNCTDPPTYVQLLNGSKGVELNVTGPAGTVVTLYGPNSESEWVDVDNKGSSVDNKGVPYDNNPYTTTVVDETGVQIQAGTGNALADGVYFLTAQGPSECSSQRTYFCVGTGILATQAPSIDATAPNASIVTGTLGLTGATLFLFADGILIGQKTLTASGAWSITVDPTYICNVSLTAKQIESGYCISAASTAVVVGQGTTSAPTINSSACASSISTISGYSSEDNGTTIEVFVNGSSVGTTTVSNGTWSISASASTNDILTATATNSNNCKTTSALSPSVTIYGTTVLSGSFSIDNPVTEGDASVPVTVSGTSGTYTLNLYIDGDLIGSQSFSSNGIVSVTPTYASDLYTGGNLTVSLTQGNQCESAQTTTLATVQCEIPDFIGRTLGSAATDKCVSTTGTLTLTNSQSLTIYTPVDASGTQKGYSALGNGGTISMDTYPFSAAGTTTFYLKAEKLVASGNCDSISLTSVTFNAFGLPVIGVQPTDQNLCSGDGTTVYTAWTGQGPYSIQWQYNNGGGFFDLSEGGIYSQTFIGSTSTNNATLQISDVSSLDGYMYRAIITDLGVPSECQESITNETTFSISLVYISNQVITNATSGSNGAIDITVSGGDGNYTYDWHQDGTGDFDDPQDLTGLIGGNYTVTVQDGNGCSYEETFTVGGVGSINLAPVYQTNISCYGANDGQFKVRASTGTPPYTYSIDNFATSQTDSVFSNLGPGNYTIKAKDSNLAESNSVSITITEPLEMVVYATISNPSIVLTDGSIYGTIVGGTANFDISLYKVGSPDVLITNLTGSTSRTPSFTSLSEGTYYINVTDANGCTATKTNIVLTAPIITSTSCSHTASHAFNSNLYSGSDQTPSYFSTSWVETTNIPEIDIVYNAMVFGQIPSSHNSTYTWTTASTINRQIDLLGATGIVTSFKVQTDQAANQDNYSVGFYVNNTLVQTFTLNSANAYTTQTTITYNSGITYNTTSGNSTNTFEFRLPAGSSRSNFRIDDFTITFSKTISTGTVTTSSTCNNGTIDLSVSGGYSPYTYDWDTDGTGDFNDSQDLSGLAPGTYNVYVKDDRACTSSQITATVTSAPLSASISGTDPTCLGGGSNGQIAVTLTDVGSGGPYTYKLIKGATDTIATAVTAATSKTFTGLENGTYSVKIWQAAGGCNTQTGNYTINLPSFTSSISSTGATSFCSGNTTTVAVTTTGGTSPYSVVLSNGQLITNYISGTDITLSPAPASSTTITVTSVTDAASCVSSSNTGSVVLTVSSGAVAPTSLSSDRNNFCADDAGTISLTATGGSGTTLRWYTGSCGGTEIGTGNPLVIASPTATTTYYASYEASCGNSGCASVTVTVNDNPAVSVTTYTDANCAADQDGTIDITPSGGSGSYTYLWSNSSTSQDLTGLGSGNYSVTATDGNGCTATTSQLISYSDIETPIVTCQANVVQSANGGGCTRQVNLSAPSITDNCIGTITSYTWAFTGATTGSGNQTDYAGNHTFNSGITTITITATDGTNSGNCSFTVTINGDVNVTGLAASVADICQGISATATVTGSLVDDTYDITYSLSGANTTTSQSASMTVAGTGGGTFTIPSSLLTSSGSTTLNIESVSSATSSCTATVSILTSFNVSASATILLAGNPTYCQGTTAGEASYSSITGSPDLYSIDFVDASFTDITDAAVTASPLAFTIPAAISGGSYGATLTVRNSSTGCSSTGYGMAVHINEVTGGTIAASSDNCSGADPASFTESVASSGTSGGTLTYQWQSKTTGVYGDISGETSTTYDPPASSETTTYRRITTNTLNGVSCTATSNELVVTISDFNLIVSASGTNNCPDLSVLTTPAFNPDNSGYNAGASYVVFRITPELDFTTDWSFDFSITGTITATSGSSTFTASSATGDVSTPTKTGTDNSGTIVAGSNTYIDLTFQVQNTPGSAQTITFTISNADNGSGCGETTGALDNTGNFTVDAMPAVGSFN